jgi:hypothetical protein
MNDDGRGPKDPTPAEIAERSAAIRASWTDEVRISRRQKSPVPIGAPAYVKRLAEYEIRQTLAERRRTG